MSRRILFLLGAGASIPAQYPSTLEITDAVFADRNIFYQTDNTFVLAVLKLFRDDVQMNYEDVYGNIVKVRHERGRAYSPFAEVVKQYDRLIQVLLSQAKDDLMKDLSGPEDVYSDALDYIRDVVRSIIWNAREESNVQSEDLVLYADLLNCSYVGGLDLFTLNHDTLLEDYFSSRKCDFVDGFEPSSDMHACWSSSLLSDDSKKVRIYKLHGSVNWFWLYYEAPTENQMNATGNGFTGEQSIGPPFLCKVHDVNEARRLDCWKDKDGKEVSIENKHLGFLVGSENKYYSYTSAPYLNLMNQFQEQLEKHNKIVIIGYGWGDRAINHILQEWARSDQSREIMLITSGDEWRYQIGCPRSRIKYVKNEGLESVNPNEILQFLEVNNN